MNKRSNHTNKNYVEHDTIYVLDTINYTNRYRFYNQIEDLINKKLTQIQYYKSIKISYTPILKIIFDCPDEKMYPRQSERFFHMIKTAHKSGIIIETTVINRASGWASTMATMYSTAGFRNMYEDACHYYYEHTYNKHTKKTTVSNTPTIYTADNCLKFGFCDNIFLNNGKIKTR